MQAISGRPLALKGRINNVGLLSVINMNLMFQYLEDKNFVGGYEKAKHRAIAGFLKVGPNCIYGII